MTNGINKSRIPENVVAFLDRAAVEWGKHQESEFSQSMWQDCHRIDSPIEQLFYVAMHLTAEVNMLTFRVEKSFDDKDDDLVMVPQWSAGKYRVDFALRRSPVNKIVCVELDGHAFHDRDERQRRYEKQRDRFLTAKGCHVLHYTGAEVVKDPCAVALEAFNLATGMDDASFHPFSE